MVFELFSPNRIKFRPSDLEEYIGAIPNPSRGWYQIFTFYIPQQPDFQELFWSLRKDESLAMAVIHIGAYQNKALDQDALQIILHILDFFQQHEKDLILRFVYDCEGNGLLHEPTLFSQVEEHFRQLAPIVRAHTKTVFIFQGMLVGSWGEMHGSKFLSPVYMKRLNELAEAATGEYTWLAVRKPSQWRILHMPDVTEARMGLFDDGIGGSDTNLGTFGHLKRVQAQWEEPWCPEDELAFEEQLCEKVPNGGEIVSPQQLPGLSDADMLQALQRMHISYLNRVHDAKLLDTWKQKPSPWPGVNLYDYVGAHLGYRFCVRMVRVQKQNRQLWIEIAIENTGFAPCYEAYDITLKLVGADNVAVQETVWDLRTLKAGTIETWKSVLPQGKGKLYLLARRKKDGRALHFAHDVPEAENLFLGYLG